MRDLKKSVMATVTAVTIAVGLAVAGGGAAQAYQPQLSDVYVADNPASCNKRPCVLYPKTAQLDSGRIVAAFENSQSAVVGQTMPIHVSDDDGTTWRKLSDVKAPAALSTDPKYAKYTSNWTNPYLYVMPQAVGSLAKGTLLLSTVVSGADEYYNEQKAANPNWQPTGDGDRRDLAIALYSSTDGGQTWKIVDIIAQGGWQGGSAGAIGRTSAANIHRQVDPLWEPHLRVIDDKLVAFYSDENDYLGVDQATGIPLLDPENDTAPDFGNQILVHKTWDGTGSWSQPVVDVTGFTDTRNGKTEIGGGRPGMTTVAPTTDGKWLLTFEYFGGGDDIHYKVGTDPLKFYTVGGDAGANITSLPTTGPRLGRGGSPVLTTLSDGRIVYGAAGSGNVWVNDSGRSDGTWKAYQTPVPAGYSRNLQSVDGTGRLLILQAAWAGGSTGPIKYADVDLGNSEGAYYTLVNRATGQALSTDADKTQDVNLTGDRPDVITWANNPANPTQRWHLQPKGGNVTFLNKSGGRALAIFTGNPTVNQPLAQWVDDNASDKLWSLVPTTDGYVKIQSAKNTSVYVTGGGGGAQVRLGAAVDATANAAADDAQEWKLVQEAPTAATLTARRQSTGLIAPEAVEVGGTVELNAAVADPAGAKTNANVTGHVYAISGTSAAVDLGVVAFDASEKATLSVPADFAVADDVRIAVQFDAAATIWDTVDVSAAAPSGLRVSAVVVNRCVAGKVTQVVSVTNGDAVVADVTVAGTFGSRKLTIAGGKTGSTTFSTRSTAVAASTVSVDAVASGTTGAATSFTVPAPAGSCP